LVKLYPITILNTQPLNRHPLNISIHRIIRCRDQRECLSTNIDKMYRNTNYKIWYYVPKLGY